MKNNDETNRGQLVWYASYASNLAYERRFLCYIKGGTPIGSRRNNPGCRDTTLPIEIKPISLPFELFFADYFSVWDGAAAFIRSRVIGAKTLGRMYLISASQFNDVVLQENGRRVDGTQLVPEIEQLIQGQDYILQDVTTYCRLVTVGIETGHPVLTFTSRDDHSLQIAPPSKPYVKVIAAGLRETYPEMDTREIVDYLLRADGVRDRLGIDLLMGWLREPLVGNI